MDVNCFLLVFKKISFFSCIEYETLLAGQNFFLLQLIEKFSCTLCQESHLITLERRLIINEMFYLLLCSHLQTTFLAFVLTDTSGNDWWVGGSTRSSLRAIALNYFGRRTFFYSRIMASFYKRVLK